MRFYMAVNESNIVNRLRDLASSQNNRLFRNNRGLFYTLDIFKRIKAGEKPRKVEAGLSGKGSSDLIGWTQVKITPDMVGQTLAVFTAVECKTIKGVANKEQLKFIKIVRENGGIAGIARNNEDYLEIIRGK
jgi:hypothetical protein